MKRRFELGRQPAYTKLGERRVHQVRCRGGFIKFRALKLDHGSFSWPGEGISRKCRITDVIYNPTSSEFVRTKTLVKGTIVQIDSSPFRNWYQKHYGVTIGTPIQFVKSKKKVVKKVKGEKKVFGAKSAKKAEARKPIKAKPVKKAEETKAKTEKGEKGEKGEKRAKRERKDKKAADAKEAKDGKTTEKKATEKKVTEKKATEKKATEKKTETATKQPAKGKKPAAKSTKKEEAKPTETTATTTTTETAAKTEGETKPKAKKIRKAGSHKPSGAMAKKWRLRNATRVLETSISEQLEKGKLYAKLSTSPGQTGTADGYVIEGEELAFYVKRIGLKKKNK